MKVFLGGIFAAFLGIIGVLIFHTAFFQLVAGAVPLALLLGGAMAAYLGYDEVKEKLPFTRKEENAAASSEARLKDEADRYKQEVERLKSELEKAKTA